MRPTLSLAHAGLENIQTYQPGTAIEQIALAPGQEALKLASNENALGCSFAAQQAIQAAASDIFRYPNCSAPMLKEQIAELRGLASSNIALGNGSDELIDRLLRSYVSMGSEVIVSEYAFSVYALRTPIIGGTIVEVPANNYGHDLDAMLSAITDKTRVICVVNPNNPTGTWVTHDALASFLAQVPAHILVILDEAYAEFMTDKPEYHQSTRLIHQYDNLVCLRTFSKLYGLAGLRIGYAMAHDSIISVLEGVRTPFHVNRLALIAASVSLTDTAFCEDSLGNNRRGMAELTQAFTERGMPCIGDAGNFLMIAVNDGPGWYSNLLKCGIIVRPLVPYGLKEHIRITIGLPAEHQRLLKAVDQILENT